MFSFRGRRILYLFTTQDIQLTLKSLIFIFEKEL